MTTHETPGAMTTAGPVGASSAERATSPWDSCSSTSQAWWQELPQPTTSRVGLTRAAAEVLARLVEIHGPVMFHQSGGCCDGSAPMCYPQGDFITGDSDVLLGKLAVPGLADGIEVWISRAQFQAWQHTHLTIDAVPGRGAGFSLESPEGVRFLTRSRLLTDEERQTPVA